MQEICYMLLNLMQIFDVLRGAQTTRLALCTGNAPYVVPMRYQLEVDGAEPVIHLAMAEGGRKLQTLRLNARVCLEFELPGCAWLDTVLLEGTAAQGISREAGVIVTVRAEKLTGRRYFLPE